MRLEYTVTPNESTDAQALSLSHQFGGGSKWLALIVLVAILAASVLFLVWFCLKLPPQYRPYAVVALAAIFIFAFIQQRRNRKGPSQVVVDIDEERIRADVSDNSIELRWSAFDRLLESPTLYVLRDRSRSHLLIFPKRAFPDDTSRDWFRARAPAACGEPEVDLNANPGFPLDVATVAAESSRASGDDAVVLRFRYRFRDYVDRTLASWFSRGLVIGGGAIPVGAFIAVVLKDRPATPHVHSHQTPWSFILWQGSGTTWLLLPKRAFTGPEEIARCRALLLRRSHRSTWLIH